MRGDVILAGRSWSVGELSFSQPSEEIVARTLDGVEAALRAAESAAARGSWVVGFVSYEAAPALDRRLKTVDGPTPLPLVWFGVYGQPVKPSGPASGSFSLGEWTPGMSAATHASRVASIRRMIRAGDTYQVNLTFPMSSAFEGDTVALFEAMLAAQPDCYGAHIETAEGAVVSVSPELYVRLAGSVITSKPMKGTAQRGRWPEEDLAQARALSVSEKEQAGNVMIVDLVRNDLGRVAEIGSVEVPELFAVERHPTVWQLTSTVSARLAPGAGIVDLFAASFPSGSVTGAPKPSTMSIIASHEDVPRGVYCGAIGCIAPGAERAEFAVAIRTGVVNHGRFAYHVGGGITYDSLAGSEYEECLWKALVVTSPPHEPDLIETMRFEPGLGVPLLERHISRLLASAEYWGKPYHLSMIGEALSGVDGDRLLKVRLILGREGAVEVELEPLVDEPGPVYLRVSDRVVEPHDPFWYHKTRDRSRYPQVEEGVEAVLVNRDGEVTETDRSNIYARIDGTWITPELDCGLLPGVYRAKTLEEGRATTGRFTLGQLAGADEIAVTNAVRGWRYAVLIE